MIFIFRERFPEIFPSRRAPLFAAGTKLQD
jgi:hypothetical protein